MNLQELTLAIEQVSRHYAEKHGIQRTEDWAVMKLTEEVGELVRAYLKRNGQARVSAGQVLVLASLTGVDLSASLERKWLRWHPDRLGVVL